MGCHTWYIKPLVKGKDNVQKYLIDKLDALRKNDWWNEECEQESLVTIKAIELLDENSDDEAIDSILFSEYLHFIDGEPIVFVGANGYDADEPRIGGYPDTIIKSADEMFKAMETGLTNCEGNHYYFHWDKEREARIRKNIIDFFNAHPDGIIKFG